ncbi:MAG: molybdopterin-dependent oxidoreductase [Planctomycetaceae bacterium]
MTHEQLSRRDLLKGGTAAVAFLLAEMSLPEFAFPGEKTNEKLVPFLDMPPAKPNMLDWETLDTWITPQDQVFSVSHYGVPEFDAAKFRLEVTGLVENPRTFTMQELQALPKEDRLMTLECSGNGASKGFMGAVFNGKWTGTPLAPILKECRLKPEATEIVFFGIDRKEETIRKVTVEVPFGRSLSTVDALNPLALLAYERDGQPLEKRNGSPLRLIYPGLYGIANVKWLHRIEVRNGRFMGRFMGRDYVTLRGERKAGEVVFVETSVLRMNLKSIVARVTRGETKDGLIPTKAYGAVWGDGTDVKSVEVKVDEGPWRPAALDKEPRSKYCWTFFSIDLGGLKPGKHTLVSRATDVNGRVQPTAEDDEIALKKTYWEAYQQWPREVELET